MAKHAARHRRLLAAAAGMLLLLAGCAAPGNGRAQGPGNDKSSGFYGGLSGGWTRP